jgi:outer membrane protein OmpA-like peptidoglycan-associated protein
MSKARKESFFWTSYSDLMTSLFFVMLLLFILVIVLLHNKMVEIEKEKQATEKQLEKIREIEESVKNINAQYFEYDSIFKRHTLKNINVSFQRGSSNINDILQEQLFHLLEVGRSIQQFVEMAIHKNPNVKYLLIIEGQSSKDNFARNYELSYERALALVKYWSKNQVVFNTNYCELIISGSGQSSPFRIQPDNATNTQNQRFVIHIIPKTGIIDIDERNFSAK